MPAGKHRSRTLRRVKKKTPGARTKTYYEVKSPKVQKCAVCKAELKGIPRLNTSAARNASKSQKKVSRPYGGFLCSACLKAKLKKELRA